MMKSKTSEGKISFNVPHAGKECETWFSDSIPLITAHGGPGAAHEYLLAFTDLHEKYGIPIIFYDQIGCGRSTRLREKAGDKGFWTIQLFINELENLINFFNLQHRSFDFLGQSWGANTPSSVPLFIKGENALVERLPEDVRKAIEEGERTGDYESEQYKKACLVFYHKHLCRLDPWPPEVSKALEHLAEDPTVYTTMYGPSELTSTGILKDWEGYSEAHKINVPTLLINGRYNEVQDVAVTPWFMSIPKVKWIQLEKSSHMAHYEERDRYMQFVGAFLGSKKAELEMENSI
ncbi:MAG: hypothetical protein M1822_004299 [Bathelium mastoideum]|nr:MAG: hypothetical protein M1822_004299 [Bathelium mastoideum]